MRHEDDNVQAVNIEMNQQLSVIFFAQVSRLSLQECQFSCQGTINRAPNIT